MAKQRSMYGKDDLYVTDRSSPNATRVTDVQKWRTNQDDIRHLPGALPMQKLAIQDGAISPSAAFVIVDTEGGAPADDLTAINPGDLHDGMELELISADSSRVVTIKNSTAFSGIRTIRGEDIVLGMSYVFRLKLVSTESVTYWQELPAAVKISDSVSLEDSKTAASAKAVKTAYDLANSKQANLGFTPVQQGGGTGQDNSKIYIGGSPEGLRVQMGATDLGNIVTTGAGITKANSATTADTANGIGTHPWFDSLDPGGNPMWVMGLATDGSNKLRPFDPAVLRVSYAASANVAASAGIADMRVYATKTFSSTTSFILPAGGSWLVIATSASTTGGFVGVYAGGSSVTSGAPVLANCIQIAR